jgi:hypothetical protein
MGTNAKRRTTFAKLDRENKLREKRALKHAKKEARKLASTDEVARPVEGFEVA